MMSMLEKLKTFCFYVATIFGLGKLRFGWLYGSILAIPTVLLGKFLYLHFPQFSIWILGLLFIFSYVAIFISMNSEAESRSCIVLNKFWGVFSCFIMVPLKWKLFLVGFSFFHILAFFFPFLFSRVLGGRFKELPSSSWILFSDLFYGLICNLFLHLIYWIAL